MRLTEVSFETGTPIDGYGPGFFRVGGEVIQGPTLVMPGSVSEWAGYEDRGPLLAAIGKIDVLLIGTGPEIAHIPSDLRQALEGVGLGVEIMASASAARTYNVLLGEGRRIGAALLPV